MIYSMFTNNKVSVIKNYSAHSLGEFISPEGNRFFRFYELRDSTRNEMQ